MNKILVLAFILLLIPTVFAISTIQQEIKVRAVELGNPFAIEEWVEDNFVWSRQEKLLAVESYWVSRVGDCSEKARLKCLMVRYAGYECITVHGMANGQKHDWVEWKWKGKWSTMEASRFDTLIKRGNGVWT